MSKIKITNTNMVNGLNTLAVLAGTKSSIKISYAVKKNMGITARELKTYDDKKAVLIDRFGQKDEERNLKTEGDKCFIDDIEGFNKEITELNNIENEVGLYDISLDSLLNSNIELTTAELTSIEFLLE